MSHVTSLLLNIFLLFNIYRRKK